MALSKPVQNYHNDHLINAIKLRKTRIKEAYNNYMRETWESRQDLVELESEYNRRNRLYITQNNQARELVVDIKIKHLEAALKDLENKINKKPKSKTRKR